MNGNSVIEMSLQEIAHVNFVVFSENKHSVQDDKYNYHNSPQTYLTVGKHERREPIITDCIFKSPSRFMCAPTVSSPSHGKARPYQAYTSFQRTREGVLGWSKLWWNSRWSFWHITSQSRDNLWVETWGLKVTILCQSSLDIQITVVLKS